MENAHYIKGKNKEDILDNLVGTAEVGSPVHELQKMGIFVRCTEDIETALGSLNKTVDSLKQTVEISANSNNKLAAKVFWLNLILTAATVIYAAATIYAIFISTQK